MFFSLILFELEVVGFELRVVFLVPNYLDEIESLLIFERFVVVDFVFVSFVAEVVFAVGLLEIVMMRIACFVYFGFLGRLVLCGF